MQDVIEHGSGRVARIEGITVGGKTGTAENYGIINGRREKLKDHSWFVCFAPIENPKIAVAVIVENAGFGATWAGPMASLIMEKYLKDTLSEMRIKEVERIENTEIILPIVKLKRKRIDSLKKARLTRLQVKAKNPVNGKSLPVSEKKKTLTHIHQEAVKPRNEEQLI